MVVHLKPPDGTEWKVDWTNHDGGILFENGWKEFATYYSLDHGHLMLFAYKETSHFEVRIFGMSGLDIDYPFHEQISDDSVEILNELAPRCRGRPKKRLKLPMSSPSTIRIMQSSMKTRDVFGHKKTSHFVVRIFGMSGLEIDYPFHAQISDDSVEVLNELAPRHRARPKKRLKLPMSSPSTSRILRSSMQTRDVFEHKETSHFEVRIFGMSGLEIDFPFHDQISEDSVEILNELPPRCWGRPRKRLKPMSSPSTTRILRSCMKTRDVDRTPNPQKSTLNVKTEGSQSEETKHEMPIIESANRDLDGKTNRRKRGSKPLISPCPATSEALKEAKKFKLKNPSFIVKIKGSKAPNFSVAFFKKYFKEKKQNVKIRFGSKLWHAKLIYHPLNANAFISAGWHLFAKASKLKVGDVCIFELINRKDPVLDVHIYRGHGQAIR